MKAFHEPPHAVCETVRCSGDIRASGMLHSSDSNAFAVCKVDVYLFNDRKVVGSGTSFASLGTARRRIHVQVAPRRAENEVMPGRIYTFESDHADDFPPEQRVSIRAANAGVTTLDGKPGVRYEELTRSPKTKPVIARLFYDQALAGPCTELINAALGIYGSNISDIRVIEEWMQDH